MSAGALNWWQIIALFGVVQGTVVALALAARRPRRTPNLLLSALVLAFALHLASVVYYSADLVEWLPHFFGLTQPLPLAFGPLLYLYAITASGQQHGLRQRDLWHALPCVAFYVWGLPIYLQGSEGKVALYRAIQAGQLPLQSRVAIPLVLLSGVGYTVATLVALRRHQGVVAENYSSLERVNLQWLRWLALASAVVWLMALLFEAAGSAQWAVSLPGDLVVAVGITLVIHAIGFWGLRQPEIFRYVTAEHLVVPASPVSASPVSALPVQASDPALPRYERSGLPPREAETLKARLLALMEEEHLYRSAELTLGELAERLGTTPHRLSEVLNASLELSFYDFINGYRVREVQARLLGPDGARLTYLALALDAGFASKSTFNAVFKKHTGMTPSEYRRAAQV
ncbi:AraC family transcriptional regulator [Gemmatimonas sp. UBA7669]|uniref:AraC family transcriptional regulator n=1 Tax=Gemmatimonas sp. UBA7669 TaxID=1946568 RepID=UPI0025BE677A|nr:helix-turn-helix domain-containing protein [Gemmatimonas sp. UBA7669]